MTNTCAEDADARAPEPTRSLRRSKVDAYSVPKLSDELVTKATAVLAVLNSLRTEIA